MFSASRRRRPTVDRAIFWLVDRYDAICHWFIATPQESREMDRLDQELDLRDELDRILKSHEGRSN
jgi:hypothetical protein